ncbi:hypothetical protein E5991_03910 [Bifidobacterium pseudolongum]|uniref:Uncharacterized protein n=1 Tax=Bifidobacterium pseudolongum TaxID=1694 RepID=A0A4S4FAH1_9BIFI|nr:hypothetical protein [Bifidobacterium pseudolongum]THG26324.1 hypothetical protein E5991_03910 [Bifidobacterium pseudolongum]
MQIALLSNTVDIDDKREDPIFIEAIEFIERLDDDAWHIGQNVLIMLRVWRCGSKCVGMRFMVLCP